jgi:hypothetical protein
MVILGALVISNYPEQLHQHVEFKFDHFKGLEAHYLNHFKLQLNFQEKFFASKSIHKV